MGGTLVIAVHLEGLRKYAASWRVGRWGLLSTLKDYENMPPRGGWLLSTLKDYGNRPPRRGWDAGEFCPP